jgi:hypothetical protein
MSRLSVFSWVSNQMLGGKILLRKGKVIIEMIKIDTCPFVLVSAETVTMAMHTLYEKQCKFHTVKIPSFMLTLSHLK